VKTTMTVAELVEQLKEYPPDLPVFATWEGVIAPFSQGNFFVRTFNPEMVPFLVIDVEQY